MPGKQKLKNIFLNFQTYNKAMLASTDLKTLAETDFVGPN